LPNADLPTLEARFWKTDPRFVEIDGVLYPVLLTESLKGQLYSETLLTFAGLRDKFVDSAERLGLAVLANVLPSDDWSMVGLYSISAIQSYDEPFVCRLGAKVAKLKEI